MEDKIFSSTPQMEESPMNSAPNTLHTLHGAKSPNIDSVVYTNGEGSFRQEASKVEDYYQTQKIIINEVEDEEPFVFKQPKDSMVKTQETSNDEDFYMHREHRRPPRWRILYDKGIEAIDAKKKAYAKHLANIGDPECTFKPRLCSATKYQHSETPVALEEEELLAAYERNRLWKKKSEAKLTVFRDLVKDKDLDGCTFKPVINRDRSRSRGPISRLMTPFEAKGYAHHVQRQAKAKQRKDEVELLLENPMSRIPPSVLKKENNITFPRSPSFKDVNPASVKKAFDYANLSPKRPQHRVSSASPSSKESYLQKKQIIIVDPVVKGHMKYGAAIRALHDELGRCKIEM